jgi:hypothetical protein
MQVNDRHRLLDYLQVAYIDFLLLVLDNDYNTIHTDSIRILGINNYIGSRRDEMQMDFGTIIAVAAALIFYLRLIILQRHKANQTRSNQQSASSTKYEKNSFGQRNFKPQAGMQIASWYLLGMGIALILLGALMTALPIFGQSARDLWWLVLTVGILLLGLSIR